MAINLAKAKRSNRILARTLGWGARHSEVFRRLDLPPGGRSEEAFAGAVAGFQAQQGLKADGILGPVTLKALDGPAKPGGAVPSGPATTAPAESAPPWLAPPPMTTRGRLLVSEGDVTAKGALTANDAYDLDLYEMSDGNYQLMLFMKLQFFFDDAGGTKWSPAEKQKYMQDWKIAVIGTWNAQRLVTTSKGKTVSLQLEFSMQEGGWMADHWEITVSRVGSSGHNKSKVDEIMGNVILDSKDLNSERRHGELQRSAVHEFGHMLGLGDEYKKGHTYRQDRKSIMNSGMEVRPRHLEQPRMWVVEKLADYGLL